ncbi:MAG TPA: MFS transporter [Solirubrobacteraceae bacterium]|nr:MFS transporter [Solirubrobacteraceae bacterium]
MGEQVPGDERERRRLRELVTLRGYWRLALAYGLNEMCWFVGTIALAVLVYHRTRSVLGTTGFFLCSQLAPALLGPPFVARFDRRSPRVTLPVLYWSEALLYALLAWLTTRFRLAPMLVIVVVDGVLALGARSLSVAARTELLKPAGLVREGGAVASMSFSAAYLVGPLLGGLVTAIGGAGAALLLNCAVFIVMGLALLSRSIPARTVHEGPARGRLRAAIRHIRHDRPVAAMLSMQTLVLICFSIPTPLEVVYTVHTLHAGSTGYGVLMAVWGGAALVGSLAYARLRHASSRLLIAVAIVLGAAGFAVMAVAPTFPVALVGAVLAGLSNGLASVLFGVELQVLVPQSWMALAMSLNQSLMLIAPGVGYLAGGVVAALVSVRFAFGVSAVSSVAFAAIGLAALAAAEAARGPTTGAKGPASDTEDDAEIRSGTPA